MHNVPLRVPVVSVSSDSASAISRNAALTRRWKASPASVGRAERVVRRMRTTPSSASSAVSDRLTDCNDRRRRLAARVSELLLGPDGSHMVAPTRRISSAWQSALMLREGPRLSAACCETGDGSHVDVYLTKTTDYRMLLLGGSRRQPQLLKWTEKRGSVVVAAGEEVPGAAYTLRLRHGEDDVRLLSETLVAELVAAQAWLSS